MHKLRCTMYRLLALVWRAIRYCFPFMRYLYTIQLLFMYNYISNLYITKLWVVVWLGCRVLRWLRVNTNLFVCSSSLTVSEFHFHILITFEDVNVVFLKINHHKNLLQKKKTFCRECIWDFRTCFQLDGQDQSTDFK